MDFERNLNAKWVSFDKKLVLEEVKWNYGEFELSQWGKLNVKNSN